MYTWKQIKKEFVIDRSSDAYIFHCGTNDIKPDPCVQDCFKETSSIIEEIMLKFQKNCKLIISAVAPKGGDDDLEHKRLSFNVLLLNFCREKNLIFWNTITSVTEVKLLRNFLLIITYTYLKMEQMLLVSNANYT